MLFSYEMPKTSIGVEIACNARYVLAWSTGIFFALGFIYLFLTVLISSLGGTPPSSPLNWGVAFALLGIACLLVREALRILLIHPMQQQEENAWQAIVSKIRTEIEKTEGVIIPDDEKNTQRIISCLKKGQPSYCLKMDSKLEDGSKSVRRVQLEIELKEDNIVHNQRVISVEAEDIGTIISLS